MATERPQQKKSSGDDSDFFDSPRERTAPKYSPSNNDDHESDEDKVSRKSLVSDEGSTVSDASQVEKKRTDDERKLRPSSAVGRHKDSVVSVVIPSLTSSHDSSSDDDSETETEKENKTNSSSEEEDLEQHKTETKLEPNTRTVSFKKSPTEKSVDEEHHEITLESGKRRQKRKNSGMKSNGKALNENDGRCSSDNDRKDERSSEVLKGVDGVSQVKVKNHCARMGSASSGMRSSISKRREKDTMDLRMLLESMLDLSSAPVNPRPPIRQRPQSASRNEPLLCRARQNFSFTDDRLWTIEQENRRLLGRIMRARHETREGQLPPTGVVNKSSSGQRTMVERRRTSAEINRLRQHQKIDAENFTMLRRIQSAQSRRDLRRDVLLSDYERQKSMIVGCSASAMYLASGGSYQALPPKASLRPLSAVRGRQKYGVNNVHFDSSAHSVCRGADGGHCVNS